jgi:hypothetical protein
VRRETVSRYARSAVLNPAKVLPPRSAVWRYEGTLREKLGQGLTADRIWQDLVEDFGHGYSYESVKRYVRRLEPQRRAGCQDEPAGGRSARGLLPGVADAGRTQGLVSRSSDHLGGPTLKDKSGFAHESLLLRDPGGCTSSPRVS